MNKFALIGEKLSHSYSPEIHKAILKKMEVDGEYSLIEVEKDEIFQILEYVRKGRLTGINVTIPYKVEVMKYLDVITEEALSIGAVNTIYLKDGDLVGDNTDYWGFRYTIEKMKLHIKDEVCVVLGGGGSARAVIKVLEDLGAKTYLVSRKPEKLKTTFGNFKNLNIISYEDLKSLSGELLVNTTPVGMYPNINNCVVDDETIKKFTAAVDLIYNPEKTQFLQESNKGENGLYMLVAQAVKAEEIWWNKELLTFTDIYDKIKETIYKKDSEE